jgi:DNA repair protein RecO (recombination protein O)
MSIDLKYTAFIIDNLDVQEADRVYTLYTKEQGKIRALGKGARRINAKLAGNLEPISMTEISVAKGRGIGKITGSIPVCLYPAIKKNYDCAFLSLDSLKKVDRLIQGEEKDERIFGLVESYLASMEKIAEENEVSEKAKIISWAFFIQLIDLLGYRVEMTKCVSCGKAIEPDGNFFNFSRWGITCPDCQEKSEAKIVVGPEVIKFIRLAIANRLENIGKIRLNEKSLKNTEIFMEKIWQWLIG